MNINEIQSSPSKISEGYKLKLERDTDMMVLNITDTATGKRTEVRGKPGYETGGYDSTDKLHILLDKIGKSANISDLMNGEVVGINPKHPNGTSAKKATDAAFNENVSALASELEAKYNLKSLFLGDMASRNAIELHSIIVNREDQGKGTGSKVMQELIKYADVNGKIMVLDPGLLDKQHGTTSQSRLRKFYKQFGFIDNKGRNKNYEFRNLMIRYPQSNESVNEVSKEEFDAIQNGYVDIEFDKKWWPLNDDYPLIKHIGKAIGATSWTSWGKVGVPWSETEMIGGGGTYMLKGEFGHILLDAAKSFRPEQILMAQISTSNRGGGVGVKVMNAIKSYADQKGLPITIYKVTNKKFFDKFEWLKKTGEDTYEYNATKVEESAGVGRVVKGVNTTIDVGVDEIINQVKKFGNDVDRDGKPKKNLR